MRRSSLLLALLLGLVAIPFAFATPDGPAKVHTVQRRAAAHGLVANGSFEAPAGLSGWAGVNATLSLATDGEQGNAAAKVAYRSGGDYSIAPIAPQVASTTAGAVYTGTAWVRSAVKGRRICLRLREWSGGNVLDDASSCVTSTTAWAKIPAVSYTAHATRHALDLYVFQSGAQAHDSFEVDGVDLEVTAPAPAPAPPVAPAPPATTTASVTTTPVTTTPGGGGGGGAAPAPPVTTTTAAATTTTAVTTTTSAPSPGTCSLYASPSGSDSAAGTSAAPFRTAQHLSDSLQPGQTGCLEPGTYTEDVQITHGGTQSQPVTIESANPSQPATIVGRLYVTNQATDVTISHLDLNGENAANLPSPTVDSTRITFSHDDVTDDHTGICFALGSTDPAYGAANDVIIDSNRIHDCGSLPATNQQHGIYVDDANGTLITNNDIYDNADRGIQLYPDAQNTTVAYNVIDGNGEGVIFSGDGSTASSGNHVYENVISNSTIRDDVEYYWSSLVGTGNVVDDNCIWNGAGGDISDQVGFTATNNVIADPEFVNRAANDYALQPGSPCAGMGPQG